MNNTLWIILALAVIGGGYAYAQSKVEKTNDGFVFQDNTVKTYYENKVSWGSNYVDHNDKEPVHNTEVVAFGTNSKGVKWEFRTTTDDNGVFKVEVESDSKFKIKVSDGNDWVEYGTELAAIPNGTVFSELK